MNEAARLPDTLVDNLSEEELLDELVSMHPDIAALPRMRRTYVTTMSRVQTLEREAERAADQLFDKEAELEDLSSKAEALIDMLEQTDIELDDTIQEAMEAVRLCL